jgi:hypothetical protein
VDLAVGFAAPVVVRAHFLEGRPVGGHAARCSLLLEPVGEEGPATMMFVDFSRRTAPVVRGLFGAGPVPEEYSSFCSEIATRPGGRSAAQLGA